MVPCSAPEIALTFCDSRAISSARARVGSCLLHVSGHGLEGGDRGEQDGLGVRTLDGVEFRSGGVGDLERTGVVARGHLEDDGADVRSERIRVGGNDAVALRVVRESERALGAALVPLVVGRKRQHRSA